jgi:streptogramin lyase
VPQSGTSGYTTSQFIFPVAVAVDSSHNGWVANQSSNTVTKVSQDGNTISSYIVGSGPSGVAVDENNNVWVANYYNDSIGLVSSAGAVKSGSSGYTGGGIVHPQGIAIDGAGTAWVTNYRGPSLSELAAATASSPGKVLSPSTGWGTDASLLEAFGIAIDASGNLWVTNFGNNTLTEFVGLAVPVKTPLIGVPAVP